MCKQVIIEKSNFFSEPLKYINIDVNYYLKFLNYYKKKNLLFRDMVVVWIIYDTILIGPID